MSGSKEKQTPLQIKNIEMNMQIEANWFFHKERVRLIELLSDGTEFTCLSVTCTLQSCKRVPIESESDRANGML